jgi:glucosamine--fructose-6-phosphate aminotransferase (isomerizing)
VTTPPDIAPGELMAREIAEQPQVWERLIAEGSADIAAVRAAVFVRAPRFVLIAARGTSDHAALYAKYLVEVRLGLPAGLVSPSTLTLYGSRPQLSDVLFVAVSQSGGSPDLVDSMTAARSCGAVTVAVTNNPESALATAAEHSVYVHAGAELAVAATKTYTAELLALALLIRGEVPAGLPEAGARTLDSAAHAYAAADRYRYADRLVTTGRGYSYPTAREAALKLMETGYLSAQAFSGADLLHGPLAMIGPQVPVIAIATPGRAGTAMGPVVDRIRAVGADVLCVGSVGGLPVATDGVAEDLLPLLEIIPLQQLAWRLALDRGGNPDRPRGLSKVTETW